MHKKSIGPSPKTVSTPAPVSEWRFEVHEDNFIAKIQVASGAPDPGFWHTHQYTALLERLIRDAAMDQWSEKASGAGAAEIAPSAFYARLLVAIARHYMAELPVPVGSVQEALRMLLEELRANGALDKACADRSRA